MVETQTRQNTFWLWSDVVNFTRRGDFDFWSPEYVKNDELMLQYSPFGEVVEDITNGVELRKYSDKGELYLRVGNIKEFFTDLDDIKLVPLTREAIKVREKVVLSEQDILMSRSGSLGIITVVTPDIKNSIISSHIMRLRVKKEISPYYIATFLNSSFGKNQILRRRNGSPVPEINHQSLEEIRFFIPSKSTQQKVEQIVKDAFLLKKEAEADYQKCQQFLNEALGLTGIEQKRELAFWRWSDEINFIEKLHPAAYRIPKIKKVKDFIKIGDYAEDLSYGTSEDLTYQSGGVPFLRITDIDEYFQIDRPNIKYISQFDAEKLSKYKVGLNNMLVSRTGTLGEAILIDKDLKDSIFGSYFIKVKFNKKIEEKLYLEYLIFFINSAIGKEQSSSLSSGGVQTNLTIPAIKDIKIPVIKKDIQKVIVKYLQSFKTKNRLSKQKLQEAKEFVENLVKRNGE